MIGHTALLLVGMAVILIAAELFTNGIEWLGKKLDLEEAAVGSILAAVGTALPETILPIIAIAFVGDAAGLEIGVGAILGAPFMLSTAAFFVTGLAVFVFSARGRRTLTMRVNPVLIERDLRFFLVVYLLAVSSSFLPLHALKVGVACGLLGVYAYYVWRTLRADGTGGMGDVHLEPLRFAPGRHDPPMARVVGQTLISLAILVAGAQIFVRSMEAVADSLHLAPLVLSLFLAPLATELPEKFNSVLWVRNGKDTLALGNITGAMVFQSCIPVAVGLVLTEWVLTAPGLASAVITLLSSALIYGSIRVRKRLSPHLLLLGGVMYLTFMSYVFLVMPRG